MYPDIAKWLRRKVLPGLRDESRVAYLALSNDQPVGTAIVKRGSFAKFCHLRLEEAARGKALGEAFFVLMALEVRHWAKEIHFTLPESLWTEKSDFFKSFGFVEAQRSSVQYRLFDEELRCAAPFTKVWNEVLEKIAVLRALCRVNDYSLSPRLLLPIKTDYAKRILRGEKTVEIRTRFSHRWEGERVTLYASGELRSLVGEATIASVTSGSPEELWETYGSRLGCSYDELVQYASGCDKVYALLLADIIPYSAPIPKSQVEALTQRTLFTPQSYIELQDDTDWGRAVSIAGLLHASTPRPSTAGV
jgi:predicted transcriptional regulator/N-acetylglutamate synthase-like GNAT family acetyltransferase